MPSGEVGAVGASAAWLQKGCLEFSLGSRHHPHLENCRASSRQGWEGWEGASNRDAGTLTYGFFFFFQESSAPGCLVKGRVDGARCSGGLAREPRK